MAVPGPALPAVAGSAASVRRAVLASVGLSAEGTSSPAPESAPEPAEPPAVSPGAPDAGSPSPPAAAAAPSETPAPTAEPRPLPGEGGAIVRNNTSQTVDIPALTAEPLTQRLCAEGPQILIIHTHGTEAYTPDAGEEYEATDPYRTTDAARSVICVGEVLARALRAQGLSVVHDTGLYDYPSYAGCYARSEEAVREWLDRYPEIGVVIDVHRDAVGTDQAVYKTLSAVSGGTAQVMLVVGTGENGLAHPGWKENLKLALALQNAVNAASPSLARPIHLARERYNQHLCAGALILEVGTNGNTLSEAVRAAELFARAAGPVFLSLVAE